MKSRRQRRYRARRQARKGNGWGDPLVRVVHAKLAQEEWARVTGA